ncbi:MAG: DNA recombination protein RmuC [Cellvibrionaceae bacterium]|nr:DNA recombination protein RmuC [Cellvibrionaceae bacterium]
MTSWFYSVSANMALLLGVTAGFLLGAVTLGIAVYLWARRRLSTVKQEVDTSRQLMYEAREEAAGLNGQLEQMQQRMQQQADSLSEARLQLGQEFENLANRIFDTKQQQFDRQHQQTLTQSLGPLKRQLDDFKKQVADVYQKESAERNQLIGKIGELQLQTQKIGEDAVNLALALKGDNKAQGNWGELVLERLLEESGLHRGREYDLQVAMENTDGQRRNPDVIIYLPENKQLVIDAKVSLRDYERYVAARDDAPREKYLQAHLQSVRNHIRTLSKKNYAELEGLQSLDFVFIFMPVEAAFLLALQAEPKLFQEAYDKHIVLVSPTTLMSTLRTVANLWRYHKQHKNAEKIALQAGGLYDQFGLVLESLDDLGAQLNRVQAAYSTTRKRLAGGRGNLLKRIENLRELGAKTKRQLPADGFLEEDAEEDEVIPAAVAAPIDSAADTAITKSSNTEPTTTAS